MDEDEFVLEDIKDMAFVVGELTHSTPPEPPAAVVAETRPSSAHSSRSSRSNSRSSRCEGGGKLRVFRDEVTPLHTMKLQPVPLEPKFKKSANVVAHARSKSDTVVGRARESAPSISVQATIMSPKTQRREVASASGNETLPGSTRELLNQLQDIAQERNDLVERLQALGLKEKLLLSTLLSEGADPLPTTTAFLLAGNGVSTSAQKHLILADAPTLARPAINTSARQPRKQPSSKPWLDRPVSAPPFLTPTSNTQPTSGASKRVPLADKTDASLAQFDSTPLYLAEHLNLSPMKTASPPASLAGKVLVSPRKRKTATSFQIPLRFDDEADEDFDSRSANKVGSPWSLIPTVCKEGLRRGGQQKSPMRPKYYEVPHTVVRKKWNF